MVTSPMLPVGLVCFPKWRAAVLQAAAERSTPIEEITGSVLAGTGSIVSLLAPWPSTGLASRLERDCRDAGATFVFAAVLGDRLHVGPIGVPGTPGCTACYFRRRLQHVADISAYRRYLDWCEANQLNGVEALSRPLAQKYVKVLDTIRRAASLSADIGGVVRRYETAFAVRGAGRVVGLHGCPTCWGSSAGSGRDTDGLAQALRAASPTRDQPTAATVRTR